MTGIRRVTAKEGRMARFASVAIAGLVLTLSAIVFAQASAGGLYVV